MSDRPHYEDNKRKIISGNPAEPSAPPSEGPVTNAPHGMNEETGWPNTERASSGQAGAGPRCPKCGSSSLRFCFREMDDSVYCAEEECDFEKPLGLTSQEVPLSSFAQFFPAAPAAQPGAEALIAQIRQMIDDSIRTGLINKRTPLELRIEYVQEVICGWLRKNFAALSAPKAPAGQPPICDGCGAGPMLDRGGFYDCFACGHNREKEVLAPKPLDLIREYVEAVRAPNPDEDRCNSAWSAMEQFLARHLGSGEGNNVD
jgi:hypothetical protein